MAEWLAARAAGRTGAVVVAIAGAAKPRSRVPIPAATKAGLFFIGDSPSVHQPDAAGVIMNANVLCTE
jgi:hypothetical protein